MIVHVITNLTELNGAETMLCRLLRRAGSERTVVVPLMDVSDEIRRTVDNPHVVFAPQHLTSPLGFIRATLGLARLFRRERPDIVLAWMYHAMVAATLAARLSGTDAQIVWNVRQSLDDLSSLTASTRFALRLTRMLSSRPDGIIFNSHRALELHSAYGYDKANLAVIPNGFDLPEAETVTAGPARVFGIAGRFHPQKDHETFLRAAAIASRAAPDLRFVAAGRGVDWGNPDFADLVDRCGLPRETLDARGRLTDMPAFYRSIDVLVLSSRTEGFPNVVAEAMSHSRPVATTDVGDAAAIVGTAGRVVAPRDPEALAKAMLELHRLPVDEYATLASAARQRIEDDFSLPAIAAQYDRFLQGCRASATVAQAHS